MSHSIYLLVAACLTGAGDGAVVEPPLQPVPAGNTSAPEPSAAAHEEKGRLLPWLRSHLGRSSQPSARPVAASPGTPCAACAASAAQNSPVTASAEPPLAASPVLQVSYVESTGLDQRYEEKVGREGDYSWITGELFRVRSARGQWLVRYATADTEDRYGGSVILAPAVDMKNYREGDLVTVHGGILDEGRASRNLSGALYRPDNISMVERCDP